MTTKPTTLLLKRLKQLLDENHLTQGDFAQSIDMPLQRIRDLCIGRIQKLTMQEKRAIRAIYNINPNWFDTEDVEKELPSNTPVVIAKHDDFAVFIIARLITDLSKNGPVSQALNALISDYRK